MTEHDERDTRQDGAGNGRVPVDGDRKRAVSVTEERGWRSVVPVQPRGPLWLALLLVAAGFVAMGAAWNGAAEKDFVQGQFPYLLSGGLPGLGLVLAGLGVALAQARRADTLLLARKLDEVLEELRHARPAAGMPASPVQAVPDDAVAVVHGRQTYHRPTCRLVADRADVDLLPRAAVADEGLDGCRICTPQAAGRNGQAAATG